MKPSSALHEDGATSVEYALILASVFLLIVVAVGALGTSISQLFVAEWPW